MKITIAVIQAAKNLGLQCFQSTVFEFSVSISGFYSNKEEEEFLNSSRCQTPNSSFLTLFNGYPPLLYALSNFSHTGNDGIFCESDCYSWCSGIWVFSEIQRVEDPIPFEVIAVFFEVEES